MNDIYIVNARYGDGLPLWNEYSGEDAAAAVATYDQCAAVPGSHVEMHAITARGGVEPIYSTDDEESL